MNDKLKLKISEIKTLVKKRFISNLTNPQNRLRPLYIEGHAGVGKTQSIIQAAKELEVFSKTQVECKILNLQFCERPDFMGLPTVQNGKTIFARPAILPESGLGILFLDEANRVDLDIRSGMLTLIEDRNINGHKIGDGWIIVLAGNPSETDATEGQYEVSDFDTALTDRVAKIIVKEDVSSLAAFLKEKYPKNILNGILDIFPKIISFTGAGISPRSFEYGMRAVEGVVDKNDPNFALNLSVEFGIKEATTIRRLLEMGAVPDLKKAFEDGVFVIKFFKEMPERIDVLISIFDEFVEYLLTTKEIIKKHEATSFASVISSLPGEQQTLFAKKVHDAQVLKKARDSMANTSIYHLFVSKDNNKGMGH